MAERLRSPLVTQFLELYRAGRYNEAAVIEPFALNESQRLEDWDAPAKPNGGIDTPGKEIITGGHVRVVRTIHRGNEK